LLKQVLGQATHLPFKDKSFDFVVAVDVLEHLPQKDRVSSISGALRCARKKVFIGCPCGELAFRQDKALDFKYKQIFKLSFPYLTDHLTHGLPQKDWVSDTIIKEAAKLGREVQIKSESNINLNLRQFLMSGWITKNILVDFIFRKVFLLFIPFFRHFNQEPSYRQIFFVDIK
jgi:predicted SAM-dependent methyltransferase